MQEVTLQCLVGAIAEQVDVDAVVYAAEPEVPSGRGGMNAVPALGPEFAALRSAIAPLAPGQAILTRAFGKANLCVIHCIGPAYGRDEPAAELLARCYEAALQLAEDHTMSSIALPAISAGTSGYPIEEVAAVACRTVTRSAPDFRHLRLVRFVLGDQAACQIFSQQLLRAAAELTSAGGRELKN